MELVDIVDKNNQAISQTSKAEAHQKGLLHRTIISEIINSKGEWLLVKQAPDRQDPGQFVSPVGGHIKAGESEQDALKREAQEETGIIPVKFKYIGKAIYDRHTRGHQENHYFILYEFYSDKHPVLNHESVGIEWIAPEIIKEELISSPRKYGQAFHFVFNTFYSTTPPSS